MRGPIKVAAIALLVACTPERSASPKVTRVLPASPSIPVNVLRFAVEFDRPMREGFSKHNIRITDADGRPLAGVLLDPTHELWDRHHQRLTLILDPGRVKTGVGLHRKLGRAFEVGQKIRVVIEPGWPATNDVPTQTTRVTEYTIGPVDDRQPQLARWQISWPHRGTRSPLEIEFAEELDFVSVMTFVKVRRTGASEALKGDVRYLPDIRRWSFVPRKPWTTDEHELMVFERLEDLAGNNLQAAFESAPKSRTAKRPQVIRQAFLPKGKSS